MCTQAFTWPQWMYSDWFRNKKGIRGVGLAALMQACGWADLCRVLLIQQILPWTRAVCCVLCAWSWAEPRVPRGAECAGFDCPGAYCCKVPWPLVMRWA